MPPRPCLNGCGATADKGRARCTPCDRAHRQVTKAHYTGDYDQRAALVRANATTCWLCGHGPRPGDPWQADHVHPGDPISELRAAHRSCNASRRNQPADDWRAQHRTLINESLINETS